MKWVTRRKARVDRARSRRGHMALQFPVYDALYAYCRTGHA